MLHHLVTYDFIIAPIPSETYPKYNDGYETKSYIEFISEEMLNEGINTETIQNFHVIATFKDEQLKEVKKQLDIYLSKNTTQ